MMKCDQVQDLLSRYLLGELESSSCVAVQDHVADCAECRDALVFHRSLDAQLEAMPVVPDGLRSRVMDKVDRTGAQTGWLARWFGDPTMKKILVSTTSLAVLASVALFSSASKAEASDPKATFSAMRAGLARAAANGEIVLTVVSTKDGTVTTSGTLDGQALPSGIPIKTTVKREGDTLEILLELDIAPEQFESIQYVESQKTGKQIELEVVPKGQTGRKSRIGVDAKSNLLTKWTEYQWNGKGYSEVSTHEYKPRLSTPAPKVAHTAVRAQIKMRLGQTATVMIGH